MRENQVAETVNVNVEGRVATIELNRPEALNALNKDILKTLACKLKEISISDDIDIVVLTGSGNVFSAGGDIKSMLKDINESELTSVMEIISELVLTLYCLPKVTITAIKGAAAGLGMSLALATDYVMAEKSSKVAMNFINLGLIPDGGAHFFLEKLVGEAKAKQIIWKGETMSAEKAWELGLINEIVAEDITAALQNKIDEWLGQPLQAMIKTKKIFADINRPHLLKVLEFEKIAQVKMWETDDHKEGIQAFLDKRQPQFTGK
ncbi:enoyl-CoA hydratase [Bacillus sp. DNRA2]|uniref:enoyl-CoA hydratase n=1 Tax=Bacillus sp. DNRA2 TaxID=2723053 RepID=UPI00145F1C34|nr:enoyl-CoA hydratase [Bacillus sp. DNRA2]NMD72030.1 enoyl-CoA hydratase [Bacillus sp. DNRA2]